MYRFRRPRPMALFAALLTGIAAAAAFAVSRIPYPHTAAIAYARCFVEQLATQPQNAHVFMANYPQRGRTPSAFRDDVAREWTQYVGTEPPKNIVVRDVFPLQTYGNRLRRWLNGRALDPDRLSVDFWIETGAARAANAV